jgi:glycosyltransferase involved in cell wall biosynthesis
VDFLRNGETGYLIGQGDIAGLAESIGRLASNPQLTGDIGKANLERAPQHSIEECAARYESLFERLTERAGRQIRA